MANNEEDTTATTFYFSIKDTMGDVRMKNIPHSSLSNFYGLTTEDLDRFMFKFDVLCHSYDYTYNAQKMKLFLAKLKGATLHWLIILGETTITSQNTMK